MSSLPQLMGQFTTTTRVVAIPSDALLVLATQNPLRWGIGFYPRSIGTGVAELVPMSLNNVPVPLFVNQSGPYFNNRDYPGMPQLQWGVKNAFILIEIVVLEIIQNV